ncbi:S8 family serine peptidase [soil metagenome]
MIQTGRFDMARRVLALALLAVASDLVFAAEPGAAHLLAAGDPQISAPAAAQIRAILSEKALRTEVENKLDSNLLHASKTMVQLAAGNAMLAPNYVQNFMQSNVAPDNTVKVTIDGVITSGLLAALTAVGASELNAMPAQGVVTARVPATALLSIAELADVRFIGVFDPGTSQVYLQSPEELAAMKAKFATFGSGNAVYPPNVIAHGVDKVHSSGIIGTGVKVCVMSDGVNALASEQAAGRLPAVSVVAGQAGNGNEGTAMLEIIYQMAPGATLGFATAAGSMANMAANILALRNAPHNCDIIVDDWTYFLEPAFQDGIIDNAVNSVVASGGLYFSSAANSGSAAKGTSGTWQGDFVDSGSTIGIIPETGKVHSFGVANTNTLTAQGSSRYQVLSWSDPMGAASNDYDLFVLDSTNSTVLAQSTNAQTGTQNPQEVISGIPLPPGSRFVVLNFLGNAAPRALRLDTERGRLAIGTNGNTFGHNAASSAISTAAVPVSSAAGGLFTGGAGNGVESYSSDGPRRVFFSAAGAAITPGNMLFSTAGGLLRNKVDIAAADCVATGPVGGYTSPSFPYTFCGTSAAAPHAAAIAALIKSARPNLSMSQVMSAMSSTALDIEAAGYDFNGGVGLAMADAAVRYFMAPIAAATAFSPAQIRQNQTSTMTITLTNSNSTSLQNVSFTNAYPANLKNANTPNAILSGAGCIGTITAAANGGSLLLSGLTIPAGSTCTVSVAMKATTAGTYVNASEIVSTPLGLNSSGAGATLTVVPASNAGSLIPVFSLLL